MSENLGVIEYQVRSIYPVIRSTTLFDRNLEAMERSFGRVDAAASTFNGTLGRLTTAYSVGVALVVDKIVKYADAVDYCREQDRQLPEGRPEPGGCSRVDISSRKPDIHLPWVVASPEGCLEPATRGLILLWF